MKQSANGCVLCERKWTDHTPSEQLGHVTPPAVDPPAVFIPTFTADELMPLPPKAVDPAEPVTEAGRALLAEFLQPERDTVGIVDRILAIEDEAYDDGYRDRPRPPIERQAAQHRDAPEGFKWVCIPSDFLIDSPDSAQHRDAEIERLREALTILLTAANGYEAAVKAENAWDEGEPVETVIRAIQREAARALLDKP
jgi:hypothetical protein